MGILANHVPSIEPLRPGVVEVIEAGNTSKKWFSTCSYPIILNSKIFTNPISVSGGFATVHPNNKLTINVVEAASLDVLQTEPSG